MAGHWDSIGFAANEEMEILPFVKRAVREGDQLEVLHADPGWGGKYVCWEIGRGVQIWVNVNEKGAVTSYDPHFAGRGRAYVTIDRSYDYDTAPPTGGIFCYVGEGTGEETKAGVDLPGFARFYDMACDVDGRAWVQITAFTHGAEVFDNAEHYLRAQRERTSDDTDAPQFAIESFLPIGLFDDEGRIPPAAARLSGTILEAKQVENPLTGRKFWAALVKTVGMTVDVVADDDQITGEPAPGKVLSGAFWLSGLGVDGPRPRAEATITITAVEE